MRVHSLELQAVGPYATMQRIDFDRLAGSGLFLLEGPTGAGKTTILDAITFALYGGLAGEESGADRLHSDFAAPDVEPTVTAEFSLRGIRYQITRTPEYQRLKKRGDGYTTQAMAVHLRRLDDGSWVSLSSNKAEVGELITAAIGLSRDQFNQVMLLPQGEFAKFLRCDDDDRRKVLTRLFGTQLYDRITTELDCRRADALRQRQDAEAAIKNAVSAAAEAAGLDSDARGELLSLTAADRNVRFKEISDELAATIAITAAAVGLATSQATAALAAEQQAKQRAALMTRLTRALAELREHEDTRTRHDQRADLLAAAGRAEPVRPLLAVLADTEARARTARAALLTSRPGADDDMLAGHGGPAAQARAESGDREAAALRHLVDAEAMAPGRDAALGVLQRTAGTAADRIRSLEAIRQELPDRIGALEDALASARSAAADVEPARQAQAAVATRSVSASRLAELEPLLAASGTELRCAVEYHHRQVDEHQGAMDARLSGMAAELAAGLGAGVTCPVCGSLDHPAPAQRAAAVVTAEAVATARELRDAAAASRDQAQLEHDALAEEVTACAAMAAGRTAASLAAEAVTLAGRLAAAEQAGTDVARLEPDLADLRAEQERLGDELVVAAAAAAAAREQADKALADLAVVRAELEAARRGYPTISARQAALRQAAQAARELGAALEMLAVALAAAAQARDRAEAEALSRGFSTLELARAAVLAPAQQSVLAEQVTSRSTALTALTSTAQAADLAGLDPGRAAQIHASADLAGLTLDRAREAEQEALAARGTQTAKASRLRLVLAEVQGAEDRNDVLIEATDPVVYLAGLAKGMAGHRRVALTTYVLRHWFEQVIAAANIRLSAMSSGRYELRRTDEGATKRDRAGLTLSVIDRYTGEERSPRSLSGGETFYASLALALGLADVVKAEAGGVDLDTLFIDEGFGSLDTETLDQVLGVIDDLRDHGRVVGIVSHVADLLDRVAERLEVRRLPDGSSTVRVVA